MDNLTHALCGAALAKAGLERHLPRATLALAVAANIPDVDALAYLGGPTVDALLFRRGWTHGVLLLALWPLLIGAVLRWDARRRGQPLPRWGPMLGALAVGVLSHPLLDWLNDYGVRVLMPFSATWFRGDAIFIVDPLFTGMFALGWWLSRRAADPAFARIALGLATLYAGSNWLITRSGMAALAARHPVGTAGIAGIAGIAGTAGTAGTATAEGAPAPSPSALGVRERLVVHPVPANPLAREGIVNEGPRYSFYRMSLGSDGWSVTPTGLVIDTQDRDPRAAAAARTPTGVQYLRWARLPFFICGHDGDPQAVLLGDVRYVRGAAESWASFRVRVTAPR